MHLRVVPMFAVLMVLCACGGGGGGVASAGSNPGPGAGTGGSNTSITDLRVSQTFVSTSAASNEQFDLSSKTAVVGTATSDDLTVSYDADSKTYSLSTTGRSARFAPSDITTNMDGEARYQKTSGNSRDYLTLVTTPYTSTTANQYVGLGYWQHNDVSGTRQDTYFSTFTYGIGTAATAVPRTGTASFTIDVFGLAAIPGYEPRVFQGSGAFLTDFGAGVFSAHSYLTETGLLSGSGVVGGGIELTAGGKLSASSGQFSGNALYEGFYGSIGGTIDGRFYGPSAQEVGASFSGSDADGAAFNGAFTGQRDAVAQAGNLTLTNLTGPQLFYTREADLTYTTGTTVPQARTSTMISQLNRQDANTFSYSPGRSDLYGGTFTDTAKVASVAPNFTSYRKTFNGEDVSLDLYTPGAGNTELSLTYLSFGRWRGAQQAGVTTTQDTVYFAYGLETPRNLLLGKTGSGHYAGVAYGSSVNELTGEAHDLKGASAFDVDFDKDTIAATIALADKGDNPVDFGTYHFDGKLQTSGDSTLSLIVGANELQGGSMTSTFFGPDGEEIGAPFEITQRTGDAWTRIAGAAVARRQ